MALFDRVADLPVAIDGYGLETRERETSSGFTRRTTVVALDGGGYAGYGEDVTYDADEHVALAGWDGTFDLAGEYTLAEASDRLAGIDLFPTGAPDREAFRHYRRWGFESALLDLALRQAETTLGEAVGRDYAPVRFVVSTRLGEPPTVDRVREWLGIDPSLEFKLDATTDWTTDLIDDLAATGRVRVLDCKGQYEGVDVGQPPDPALYRRLVEAFPEAIVEDPALTDATRAALADARDRVSWDAPITDVASIEALPWTPGWLNVKPSRFGSVERLFDAVDYCLDHGIRCYGGGQFELDVGRAQIQALASLFYPDAPNDVAPGGYNDPEPRRGLASSPLAPPENPVGFGRTGR